METKCKLALSFAVMLSAIAAFSLRGNASPALDRMPQDESDPETAENSPSSPTQTASEETPQYGATTTQTPEPNLRRIYGDWDKLAPLIPIVRSMSGDSRAYLLWNVTSEADMAAMCEEHSQRANADLQAGGCREEYVCSYDQTRFPAALVTVRCLDSSCSLKSTPVNSVQQCFAAYDSITVLTYVVRPTDPPRDEAGESSGEAISLRPQDSGKISRTMPRGHWYFQEKLVTYECTCALK